MIIFERKLLLLIATIFTLISLSSCSSRHNSPPLPKYTYIKIDPIGVVKPVHTSLESFKPDRTGFNSTSLSRPAYIDSNSNGSFKPDRTGFNSPSLYEPIYTNSNSPTYTTQDYDNFMIHEAPHQQVEFDAHVAPHVVPHIMPPTPSEVLEFNAHVAPHLHFQHLK